MKVQFSFMLPSHCAPGAPSELADPAELADPPLEEELAPARWRRDPAWAIPYPAFSGMQEMIAIVSIEIFNFRQISG